MVVDHEVLQDEKVLEFQSKCKGLMAAPEVSLQPSGCVVNRNFLNYVQQIRDMEVRPDDIWICTYPKCGTTWSQEMIWLLKSGLDFKKAKSLELYKRFPFLDFTGLWPEDAKDIPNSIAFADTLPSPRFIKSHLPPSLLPKQLFEVNPKIIYVHRNPKDAAVSYYHHFRLWNNYEGTLDEFLEIFLDDKMIFSPFWEHVFSFWELKDKPNILINSFEEMKQDLSTVMLKTAKFLEVEYNDEEKAQLLDHLSFKSMQNNPMVNFEAERKEMGKEDQAFIRQGNVGSWKKEMSDDIAKKFEIWSKDNLEKSDFPYYRIS